MSVDGNVELLDRSIGAEDLAEMILVYVLGELLNDDLWGC